MTHTTFGSADTLRIDVDAPQGRIVWEVPVNPTPGQPASQLADRIQEMLSLLKMRKRYAPRRDGLLTFREQQTLKSWESAYKKAVAAESRIDELLGKHLKAG
ncbi:hypothetical protein [Vreelandella massiliensis]|uniref:hypothetical protein n=1 Tax=Vreelandella massiliensis TaxID=1816686 RepID=UPI00096A2910|nr:hypothetical protein [Halomonas massiliensis]